MTFQISVLPSGRSFVAQPGEVLLAAAIREGVGLPYGCKDGACGSCKCLKVSGEIQMSSYQSKALTDEELAKGMVLTCRARATSDLVIDAPELGELRGTLR